MADIAVIGAGYVGLTTAVGMATWKHNVVCGEIIREKVERLQDGDPIIYENGLAKHLNEVLKAGNLKFVHGATKAVTSAEYVFMCLPTPQLDDGSADLSYLLAAAKEIAPYLQPNAVVINKSTVPVGSAELVAQAIQREDVHVASNPEFLQEGQALDDFFEPARVVIGVNDDIVGKRVASLYDEIPDRVYCTGIREAESIKYTANFLLAARLAAAFAAGRAVEEMGADAIEVLDIVGRDPRIGGHFMQLSPGYGGSCFPKDNRALIAMSEEVGVSTASLDATIQSNQDQIAYFAAKVDQLLGGELAGKTIAVWGLSFKPNTDDTRESPSLVLIRQLIDKGANVQAYDPRASDFGMPKFSFVRVGTALEACEKADALLVLTKWHEFATQPFEAVKAAMAGPIVADAHNILPQSVSELGFTHYTLGRGVRR